MLSSPWTLLPTLGGITAMAAGWGADSGTMVFAGLAALLAGLGVQFTRLMFGAPTAMQRAVADMQKESQEATRRRLDDLDRRLLADRDPRTETYLRELRALVDAFRTTPGWTERLTATSTFDIVSGVEELFAECVRSLEKTLELWHAAAKLPSDTARRPLLDRREQLIEEVRKSVDHISRILASVQSLDRQDASTAEMTRLREELENSLAVAKRVDEMMKTWRVEAGDKE
jgi:hypothetical protein